MCLKSEQSSALGHRDALRSKGLLDNFTGSVSLLREYFIVSGESYIKVDGHSDVMTKLKSLGLGIGEIKQISV